MTGENNNNSDRLIDIFTKGFEETKTITQNLQNENQSNALALSTIRTEVNGLHQDTDWLIKNVRDESGDRSLMARVLILENNTKALNDFLAEQKKKEDSKTTHLESLASEDHKGKWQLRIALATGCLGFIATVITALFGYFLKK